MESTRLILLLNAYFANTCSPEEKDELMQLINSGQHDEHLKTYINDGWGNGQVSEKLTESQSQPILAAILSTQNESSAVSITPVRALPMRMWAAAAVLLIAISSVTYLMFRQAEKTSSNSITASAAPKRMDIAPGTEGAVLTLADGTTIVLDSAADGNLARQGTATIVKNGGALKYTSSATASQAPAYNTIGTPRGRQFQLVLEDGTNVWLNAQSSIRFPTTFAKNVRSVAITGEVYFEVAKNASRPFKVAVKDAEVQVLGTHFNINAYDDEDAIKTTLVEGAVKVLSKNATRLLAPGQQANLAPDGALRLVNNANLAEIVAWKNDLFSFDNTDIYSLARQLSRWYEADIQLPPNPPNILFSGTISRKSNLSEVLTMLELTGEVTFRIEGKKVHVNM